MRRASGRMMLTHFDRYGAHCFDNILITRAAAEIRCQHVN
jgi:hypothetical protein